MEKSNVAEELRTMILEKEERKSIKDPIHMLIQKSFVKIAEDWNGTEESRKFIKHLIVAFIGKDKAKVMTEGKGRCCILAIKLATDPEIDEVIEKYGEDMLALANCHTVTQLEKEVYKTIKEIRKEVPIEKRGATLGYRSEKSNKLLSADALRALEIFVDRMREAKDTEVEELFKPRKKKFNGKKREFSTNPSGTTFRDVIDEDLWRQLSKIASKKK